MQTSFRLDGRRVLITGAASGIGAAAARLCARQGAALVLVDIQPLDAAAEELTPTGALLTTHQGDAAERRFVEQVVAQSSPLDGLVVAAALCPWEDWLEDGFEASLDRVLRVNLAGPLWAARACLPRMMRQGRGRIVIVSSLAGKSGGLIAGPHYVASKGGLNALVKWLAQRGGPSGVTVNGIAPASIATPMMQGMAVDTTRIPLRRMGEPEEVAAPIVFLLSDAASYVTGTVLDVNGGVYMA